MLANLDYNFAAPITNVFRASRDMQYYFGNFNKNDSAGKNLLEVGQIALGALTKGVYYKDY